MDETVAICSVLEKSPSSTSLPDANVDDGETERPELSLSNMYE